MFVATMQIYPTRLHPQGEDTVHSKEQCKSAYGGVTFHFDIPNRNDLDRERLNKEFLGLSVTHAFLQEQITYSEPT